MRDFDCLGGPHRIPTKIINASSFGIPCIACPQQGNKEIEGYYIPAVNMNEIFQGVEKLSNPAFYDELSEKCLVMAEKYHISNIAKLYQQL